LPLGAGDDYGYAWHLRSYIAASRKYRAYEAQGNGGQILDVVPQLDLAVMMTAGNYNNFLTWGKMRDRIMLQILAATSGP
jgi:CubicO group peptidase (beta-lactamase class C family)